jgi:hypothetical protein
LLVIAAPPLRPRSSVQAMRMDATAAVGAGDAVFLNRAFL